MSLEYNPISRKFEKSAPVPEVEEKALPDHYRDFITGDPVGPGVVSLKRAYQNSVWVMRAIKHSALPITEVGLSWSQDREEFQDDAIDDFFAMPAQDMGGRMDLESMVQALVGWKKLKGEFFLVLDDTWLAPTSISVKSPVIVARPDEMREICDPISGELVAWQYRVKDGKRTWWQELFPDQVIHKKDWNPYHPIRGLAEYEAAEIAAETDYSAGTFAKAVMDSNGDLGPIITGDGQISDEQYEQITRALREKRERNRKGDFRPFFLVGSNLSVNDPMIKSADAQFIANREWARGEIFVAFGVPPSFAESVPNYSVGSASDRYRNIQENCKPMAKVLAAAFSEIVNGHGVRPPVREAQGDRLVCRHRWEDHPTMQEVRSEQADSAEKLVRLGVPWRTASDYLNMNLPEFPGDEVGRVPFNMTPVESAGVPPVRQVEGRTIESDKEDAFALLLKTLESAPERITEKAHDVSGKDAGCPHHVCKMDGEPEDGAEVDPRWLALRAMRTPWEKRFKGRFTRLIMQARVATLEKIAAAGNLEVPEGAEFNGEAKTLVTENKMGALDLIFDLPDWLEEFLAGMAEVQRAVLFQSALDTWEELGIEDDPSELPERVVITTLRKRENYMVDVADDVHREVLETIEEGLNGGDTMEELSDRVRGKFNDMAKSRADMVARTETTAIYETGRQQTFKAAGIEFKEWLTSGLGNVRLSHWQAERQIVGVDESFQVGGAELLHPGDSNGPAKEVINCNCVSIASRGPKRSGRGQEESDDE